MLKDNADVTYAKYLELILNFNNIVSTRNNDTYCHPFLDNAQFWSLPLITTRRTAWKSALLEMEWFMSGTAKCPEKLSTWWQGQLNSDGEYLSGYSEQLRMSVYYNGLTTAYDYFDQVGYVLDSLIRHPNSRRMVMTTWNTGEMANITKTNKNSNTPSNCHGTITQFFVVDDAVHMKTYQRSADMLLGVPHNWVQYWALLQYFAHHSGRKVGSLTWVFGDAHIYNEETHISAANEIIAAVGTNPAGFEYPDVNLVYTYSGEVDSFDRPAFKAEDFSIEGNIPAPIVTIRPKLL